MTRKNNAGKKEYRLKVLVAREVINVTKSVSAEKSKMGDYGNRSKIVNNQTLPMDRTCWRRKQGKVNFETDIRVDLKKM